MSVTVFELLRSNVKHARIDNLYVNKVIRSLFS
jgi:hypothetical protein